MCIWVLTGSDRAGHKRQLSLLESFTPSKRSTVSSISRSDSRTGPSKFKPAIYSDSPRGIDGLDSQGKQLHGRSNTMTPRDTHRIIQHHQITHILSIVRFSSYDNSVSRQQRAIKSAEDRITHYCQKIHPLHGCKCEPSTSVHFINGMSSNADVSTSDNAAVLQVVSVLNAISTRLEPCGVVFMTASIDGFTTNLHGLSGFFGRFEAMNFKLVVLGSRSFESHDLADILQAVRLVDAGEAISHISSPSVSFVRRLVQTGLNKAMLVL